MEGSYLREPLRFYESPVFSGRLVLTNQQQAWRITETGFGGAMNAGQHWRARVGHSDAPEIAESEAIGFGLGGGDVVEVVAVVAQVVEKVGIIGTAVFLEKCRACLCYIDSAHSLLIG